MSKKKDKRMRRRNEGFEKPRTCDPGMCPFCEYKGDGNCFCTKFREYVLKDWETTSFTLICKTKRGGK